MGKLMKTATSAGLPASVWRWAQGHCWSGGSTIGLHCRTLRSAEGDDRGWDGWMASLTQWTWVWANSRRLWMTGKPDVPSTGLQSIRHDVETDLGSPRIHGPFLFWLSASPDFCFSAEFTGASSYTCLLQVGISWGSRLYFLFPLILC